MANYKTIYKIHDGTLQGADKHNSYTHDADEARAAYQAIAAEGPAYLESQVDYEEPGLGEWDLVATNVPEDQEHVVAGLCLYQCPRTSDSAELFVVVGCGHVFQGAPDDEGQVDCPNCGIWFTPAREPHTVLPR